MLTHISIANYAIVDHLDLELTAGMTVITGETGAGKSILLDALGLVLGDRADGSVIRHGCDKADISVGFQIDGIPEAKAWLEERDAAMDGECLLRRTLSMDGRSRSYINGQPFPLQALRELGEWLVDIHGQHSHQSLLRRDTQRDSLDAFAGNSELLSELKRAYQAWSARQRELEILQAKQADRESRLELLRYQVNELQALDLKTGELADIEQEHQRLAHANKLLEGTEQALFALYENDEGAVLGQLQKIIRELDSLQAVDARLAPIGEFLGNAAIQLEEAVDELRRYQQSVEVNPGQLAYLEQRLADIHDLARKHHCPPGKMPELLHRLGDELAVLEQAEVRLESLHEEIAAAAEHYRALAARLSKARQQAAKKLARQVTDNMQQLGMQRGRFDIALHVADGGSFSQYGLESVEFMVSANPGQPLQPLGKVASGGELSRISLAIQVITAATHGIPTLVFDEVDVGIGGGTAEIVGHLLRKLSARRQVLCVTHQPQVAALGHHHLHVSKQVRAEHVDAQIITLSTEQRIEELARMLGGIDITRHTRLHA
ncbi:MAG: DNA repair protein RecN, partial [Gammaproteobacteria bacterium RBG_16_57_12]